MGQDPLVPIDARYANTWGRTGMDGIGEGQAVYQPVLRVVVDGVPIAAEVRESGIVRAFLGRVVIHIDLG